MAAPVGFSFVALKKTTPTELVERGFPTRLKIPHPLAIFVEVVYVDNYFGKRVGVENTFVMPVAFDSCRFKAGRSELVNDFF